MRRSSRASDSRRMRPSQPQWNSGEYLATALGHCAECHTPRNLGFGLEHGKELAGSGIAGMAGLQHHRRMPSMASAAGAIRTSPRILKSGHAPGTRSASGPMGEAVAHSLQYPDRRGCWRVGDLPATVPGAGGQSCPSASIRNLPPVLASSDAAPGGAIARPRMREGRQLFEGACASCHQWNGTGPADPLCSIARVRAESMTSAAPT